MLICGAETLRFPILGGLWSPRGSELQWELLAEGEISIKIVRMTKVSGNPREKDTEILPQVAHVSR